MAIMAITDRKHAFVRDLLTDDKRDHVINLIRATFGDMPIARVIEMDNTQIRLFRGIGRMSLDRLHALLTEHGFVCDWSKKRSGNNPTERTLRALLREALDLAEEANGDPGACSYNVPIGERVADIRKAMAKL